MPCGTEMIARLLGSMSAFKICRFLVGPVTHRLSPLIKHFFEIGSLTTTVYSKRNAHLIPNFFVVPLGEAKCVLNVRRFFWNRL